MVLVGDRRLIPHSSLSPPLRSERRLVISSLVRNGRAKQRVAKKRLAAVARSHGPSLRSNAVGREPRPAYLLGEVTSAPACRNPGARQSRYRGGGSRPSRSRVRRWSRPHPLPSEPDVHLSMLPAQASDNDSAGYDRARLRRPTTPLTSRGRPIGLGVNLDGTTAEPATEDRRRPHLRTLPSETSALPPEPVSCRFLSADTRGKSARFRAG
jgi:hypothetical protein